MLLTVIIIGVLVSKSYAESCNTLWTITKESQEMTIVMCIANIEQTAIGGQDIDLINDTNLSNITNISSVQDIYNINNNTNTSLYNVSLTETNWTNYSQDTSAFPMGPSPYAVADLTPSPHAVADLTPSPSNIYQDDLTPSPKNESGSKEEVDHTKDEDNGKEDGAVDDGDLEIITSTTQVNPNLLNVTNMTDSENLKTDTEEKNNIIIISSICVAIIVLIILSLIIMEKRKSKGIKPLCSTRPNLKNGTRRNPLDRPKDYIIEQMVPSPLTQIVGRKDNSENV